MANPYSTELDNDFKPNTVPPPPYRHAAPSAPWPWIDIRDAVDQEQLKTKAPPVPKDCDHTSCNRLCWEKYPQSRFPNWTPRQVKKCKIHDAIEYDGTKPCIIYKLDVDKAGMFLDAGKLEMLDSSDKAVLDAEWIRFKDDNQTSDIRVRALFVENMSGPALRMLGGKYNIEPFFFSSSLNWIPSHFQEDLRHGVGDHLTITLPFIQSLSGMKVPLAMEQKQDATLYNLLRRGNMVTQKIDTQAPLRLKSDKALVFSLLSVHLVRNIAGNTLISFHPTEGPATSKALYLHERIRFAGQSVYWQKMLTDDPTFLLLIFVWHAMYAWDEALQHLYEHICVLETDVIRTSSMDLTEELHMIQAHLLHYSSLVVAFKKIVKFIMDTPNPALSSDQKRISVPLLNRECKTLLEHIDRLDEAHKAQESRLANVLELVFSSVRILDSKTMQKMTETTVRDSSGKIQLDYLAMLYFPASFLSELFHMNVPEFNPTTNGYLPYFVLSACVLTAGSVWIMFALQSPDMFNMEMSVWQRLGWPFFLVYHMIQKARHPEKFIVDTPEGATLPGPFSRPSRIETADIELTSDYVELSRIPPPAYRHAAPSAPWPWIDIRDGVDQDQLNTEAPPVPEDCDHTDCDGECWKGYPQSRFPNWTPSQVEKCKIHDAINKYDREKQCVVYKLDVDKQGIFHHAGTMEMLDSDDDAVLDKEWDRFKGDNQTSDVRIRALFVENMTGPVLRMLGGKYNIEPFFFSSSLNWIPSHFQEDLRHGVGDHITITLPFIRSLNAGNVPIVGYEQSLSGGISGHDNSLTQTIDTQAPLRLKSSKSRSIRNKALVSNLLSVHLVRNVAGNTLVSFHANMGLTTTRASYLHERVRFAGQSVYWQKMLEKTDDPTFLLLIFIWHAMYAWDEALQHLYEHICVLETDVIRTSSMELTEELHMIRAHLLHYSSLVVAFKEIVLFILDTPNPALTPEQRSISTPLLNRECKTLLHQIDRLDEEHKAQEGRLTNVIELVFSSVNILESRAIKKMTEATVKDSAGLSLKCLNIAMKQIAYVTMVFLPAHFVSEIFNMNVKTINPSSEGRLAVFFIASCVLFAATFWVIIAFQSRFLFDKNTPYWKRLGWPFYLVYYTIRKAVYPEKFKVETHKGGSRPLYDLNVQR
ncbi:hypothetical protein F5887DRAFT_1282922 [Amanita rubescens]|nr:hypothetical protein F5887DRAFT_1282922 [Amanita rubescens]